MTGFGYGFDCDFLKPMESGDVEDLVTSCALVSESGVEAIENDGEVIGSVIGCVNKNGDLLV